MKKQYTYDYPMPAITADVVVSHGRWPEKILLVKRKKAPYKGRWALPGGFLEMNETLYECAQRELKEETNLDIAKLTFLEIRDQVGRDPRGRTVSVVYYKRLTMGPLPEVKASDDAQEVRWFNVAEIEKMSLAFDHKEIIFRMNDRLWRGYK